ncbi:MAG TPA: hypothetical protein PKC55_14370 [Dysgonomonas sp.]|uniref:DUF4595 domain-containing protein n=1 Tax=uncultured Dysgonomonas sp. TaxID=206096 RepID=A0A212J7D1_9BACT|nr:MULTISPECIES: hypothetical protein [unclassified Dysgonomonas]SBV95349.1 exported hypothetical protein [uncultured Dysgonomonas sp.]HML66012.1 hypothetical protein [Dysgonomonas sp.]
MKKLVHSLFATMIVVVFSLSFVACGDDDEDNNGGGGEVKASKVKTLNYKDDSWEETFTFTYQDDGKISKIVNSYEGGSEEIIFDWKTANKLTVTRGDKTYLYDVNSSGYITKEYGETSKDYYTYEYDGNGFITKIQEFWDGGSEVKYTITINNGNVTKHARVRDGKDYEKTFEYATGVNTCNIQQTNPVDSYWKTQAGLYGKASNKLVERLNYGYVGETASTTVLQYSFDTDKRPSTITRGGDGWTETLTYTYY